MRKPYCKVLVRKKSPDKFPEEWITYGYSESDWRALSYCQRWRIRHPGRQKLLAKEWITRNVVAGQTFQRRYQLKKLYGLSLQQYDTMLESQDGKCAICKEVPKAKNLCIDHDHDTGTNRGLLCNKCNRGIGYLGDNIQLLKQSIQYLEHYKEQHENRQISKK